MNETFTHQVQAAIAAHGIWKARLKQAIVDGHSDFTVDVVIHDNQCDFGRWLYSPACVHDAHYEVVRRHHAEFHKAAAHVLGLAVRGHKAEAEAAMALGSPYAHVSATLIGELMRWQKEAA
jgi:hypothetical protein